MVDRVFRPLFQAAVAILLVVSVAATVLLFGLQGYVYSERLYRDIPNDPAFVQGMTDYVLDDLEAECLFYDLPFDTIKTAVTTEWIRELSRQYTASVYTALCSGEELKPLDVDPAPYRAVIDSFFASLPEEERPLDVNAAATLSQELATSTEAVLAGGIINRFLGYGHDLVYGDTPLRKTASMAWWSLAAAVLFAVLSLIPWGGRLQRFYATAGSLFVGSALAFVPLWLLKRHDLVNRLVLGDSPLKLYVGGILDGAVGGMTAAALWVFIGCAVLLVAAAVLLVRYKAKENKE